MQKKNLEARQGIVFRDPDLDHAIEAVDLEIDSVQGELTQQVRQRREEKSR